MEKVRPAVQTADGEDGLPRSQRRRASAVIVLGTLMAVLDLGAVNLSLATMARELAVPMSQAVWITTLYQLVCAASLLACAALGRRLGQRRVFAGGIALFSLGALGAALSSSLETLLACRALQGLGGAAILSLGPSLYRMIYPRHLLGRAIGLNALVVASGLACGPLLGGVVIAVAGWSWIFALNVPAGLAALLLARRALPREAPGRNGFDWRGALLSALMMGGFVLAMERLGHGGSPGLVIAMVAGSLGVAGVFAWWQRRAAAPLVPPALFAAPRFASAAVVTALAFTGQGAVFVALPILYQEVMGASPLQAALLFTPWPLALMLSGPLAGRMADRRDPALLAVVGLGLFLVGVVGLAWLSGTGAAGYLLLPSLLCGFGYGVFQAPNNREIMGSVPVALSAGASGVLASVRTFGQCLGAASVALVMAMSPCAMSPCAMTHGMVTWALWLGGFVTLAALALSAYRLTLPREAGN